MLTNDDLQAIKEIVKGETEPLKQQLDTVEMKVETVNDRVGKIEERLEKAIKDSQEDTISAFNDTY